MLKISKSVDYSLILLSKFARQGDQYQSIKHLSLEYQLPYKFCAQLALKLKVSGILESHEGVKGGYRLAKPSSTITLLDVVTAIEGPIYLTTCQLTHTCKHKSHCDHYQILTGFSSHLKDFLSQKTLAQITTKNVNA